MLSTTTVCGPTTDGALSINSKQLAYLTPRQAGVLRIIGQLRKELNGKMPTAREIARAAGVGPLSPWRYPKILIKKGYLEAGEPRMGRTLRLTKNAEEWLALYKDSNPVDPRPQRPLDPQRDLPLALS